jgi:replicative DNA helicase
VILLARQYLEDGMPNGEIKADLAKNRFGRTGVADLTWRAHYALLGSVSREPETDWSNL